MGHDKLRKFAENETFSCLLQPSAEELLRNGYFNLADHPVKGRWNELMFGGRDCPIVVELGCGKGEYTIALAERNPDVNYIGVDIKGARLWKGAKYATEHKMPNVAFLRTRIEFIGAFFAPGEVSQVWLTFSDPQMKSENSRLTSPLFLERYRNFMKPGGIVNLKTDSRFLFEYTKAVCEANALDILAQTTDLYGDIAAEGRGESETASLRSAPPSPSVSPSATVPPLTSRGRLRVSDSPLPSASPSVTSPSSAATEGRLRVSDSLLPSASPSVTSPSSAATEGRLRTLGPFLTPECESVIDVECLYNVQTFYEKMFLEMGCKITYLSFVIDRDAPFIHPEFDEKYWRQAEGGRRSFSHAPTKKVEI